LFTALHWWLLQPADHLMLGRGENGPWCLADPGRQYVIYTRSAKSVAVRLSAIGGGYQLEHFDTASGKRTAMGVIPPGDQQIDLATMPPWKEDCVLILTADPQAPAPATTTTWSRPVASGNPAK
jgi:hypothetical protein